MHNLRCIIGHFIGGYVMRNFLPLLLAGLVILLTGCGKGQVMDGADMFRAEMGTPETTDAVTLWTAVTETQTETDAEPAVSAAAPTTPAPTAQTTTQPTTPAPNGTADFTVRYIRTDGVPEGRVSAHGICIADRSALDAYRTQYRSSCRTADKTLEEAFRAYDDAWFATHTLLLAVLEEGSGSVRHTVTRVEKTAPHAGTVEIKRDVPQVGTCDMAYWHILIELPAGVFGAADTIEVVMQ